MFVVFHVKTVFVSVKNKSRFSSNSLCFVKVYKIKSGKRKSHTLQGNRPTFYFLLSYTFGTSSVVVVK